MRQFILFSILLHDLQNIVREDIAVDSDAELKSIRD